MFGGGNGEPNFKKLFWECHRHRITIINYFKEGVFFEDACYYKCVV
jgi:hypothetical protein